MTRKARGHRHIIELHHPPVYLADLRRAAGGKRRFGLTSHCMVGLPDGREVRIDLTRRPGTLGGQTTFAACPGCGGPARVLRIIADSPGLCCLACFRKRYSAKFLSQIRGQQKIKVRTNEKDPQSTETPHQTPE